MLLPALIIIPAHLWRCDTPPDYEPILTLRNSVHLAEIATLVCRAAAIKRSSMQTVSSETPPVTPAGSMPDVEKPAQQLPIVTGRPNVPSLLQGIVKATEGSSPVEIGVIAAGRHSLPPCKILPLHLF